MILEGIVTTLSDRGTLNVAPMGPMVDNTMARLVLRPFQTSVTYRNLTQHPQGVLHVTDDVLLLAQAAIGQLKPAEVPTFPASVIQGRVLQSACRWYEFEVEASDSSQDRAELQARVVHVGRLRDFFGFNRAKHAVVEAAILATRLAFLPRDEILAGFDRLAIPVHKTAGPREQQAFDLLDTYVRTS
jgi:hypothetical protein